MHVGGGDERGERNGRTKKARHVHKSYSLVIDLRVLVTSMRRPRVRTSSSDGRPGRGCDGCEVAEPDVVVHEDEDARGDKRWRSEVDERPRGGEVALRERWSKEASVQ